jgi:hypothetical protein
MWTRLYGDFSQISANSTITISTSWLQTPAKCRYHKINTVANRWKTQLTREKPTTCFTKSQLKTWAKYSVRCVGFWCFWTSSSISLSARHPIHSSRQQLLVKHVSSKFRINSEFEQANGGNTLKLKRIIAVYTKSLMPRRTILSH